MVIEMKSSIANCNSNDQLLQLVPIQLYQKGHIIDNLCLNMQISQMYSLLR